MTTLFFVSVQNSSALVVPPMAIGFVAPPGNVFTAKVKASCTQSLPGLSPTQTSVWLLTVARPSGPEVSLLPVKPANPELTNCAMLWVVPSMTSTDLLLRSAKKYMLSTGSYQLMSNEKNAARRVLV